MFDVSVDSIGMISSSDSDSDSDVEMKKGKHGVLNCVTVSSVYQCHIFMYIYTHTHAHTYIHLSVA